MGTMMKSMRWRHGGDGGVGEGLVEKGALKRF